MRFLLMTNLSSPDAIKISGNVAARLRELGGDVTASLETATAINCDAIIAAEDSGALEECDIVVAVGGDGTIFRCVKIATMANKPILGVNAGRLGFLAQIEGNSLNSLERVVSGDFVLKERMLLEAEVRSNAGSEVFYAVNDCVVSRSSLGRITDIALYCDGTLIADYRADGLIVSTPTGSTAYSLSAGGPIVDQGLDCILVTAICPHAMYDRSIVISPGKTLNLRPLFDGRQEYLPLTIDGETVCNLVEGAEVIIRRSDKYANFVDLQEHSFYQIINKKLRLR